MTPAAVIGQRMPDGRWHILDEFCATDTGVIRFAEALSSYVATHYPGLYVGSAWGDPAGNQRAHSDERTALEIMRSYTGWKWRPAPSNDTTMRVECVSAALGRMIDGKPGFQLSPTCGVLRKGFSGGYHFRPIRAANGTTFHDTPAKNAYSHPHDALQYLLLGGGEHNVVLHRMTRGRKRSAGLVWDDVAGELVDPATGRPPRRGYKPGERIAEGVEHNQLGED